MNEQWRNKLFSNYVVIKYFCELRIHSILCQTFELNHRKIFNEKCKIRELLLQCDINNTMFVSLIAKKFSSTIKPSFTINKYY